MAGLWGSGGGARRRSEVLPIGMRPARCAKASLEVRRQALGNSLSGALTQLPQRLYGHGACAEEPQASRFDMKRFMSASAIVVPAFPFQNRATFQQVDEPMRTLPR